MFTPAVTLVSPGQLAIRDVEVWDPGDWEVQVKTEVGGLCRFETSRYAGKIPMARPFPLLGVTRATAGS